MKTKYYFMGLLLVVLVGLCGAQAAPTPVTEINTAGNERHPYLSFDAFTLYFARQDAGYFRIYHAERAGTTGPFTVVEQIPGLVYSGGHVESPWVSADNRRLYYYRTEPGNARKIYLSQRPTDGAAWPGGTSVVELNALGNVAHPALTEDELDIVFCGVNIAGGLGGYDLWDGNRTSMGQAFTDFNSLTLLNSAAHDTHPSLSGDGLTLYFASNRSGPYKIYKSTRPSRVSLFAPPTEVIFPDMNEPQQAYPAIGTDGIGPVLYFGANYGSHWDVYMQHLSGGVEPNVPQADYYIDAVNGNDLNTGKTPTQAFATIQRGLNAAQPGETVMALDGVYTGVGNKELNFFGKAILLTSVNGAGSTVIDCQNNGRAFLFQSGEQANTVVEGFTLTNGNSPSGGAIYCVVSAPTLQHLALVNNVSSNGGGAIRCEYGSQSPAIMNCTFFDNSCGNRGGALYAGNGIKPILSNCILWGNSAVAGGHELAIVNATLTVDYSDVQGGQFGVFQSGSTLNWGSGNIDVDPLFANAASHDVHLKSERGRYWPLYEVTVIDQVTSPGIDAGDPAKDASVEPRPNGNRINIGTYGGTAVASRSLLPDECYQLDYNGDGIVNLDDLYDLMDDWLTEWDLMPPSP
ncbi:hypothetical protein ACFL3F_02710 [Planctomycetota bacterium]